MPEFDLSAQPELVRDTYLEAHVGESSTVHTFQDSTRPRRETWKRVELLGGGGFGDVSLEECVAGRNPNSPLKRAVKKIALDGELTMLYQARELDAIAKFSQPKHIVSITKQVVGGLRFMHDAGFAHRDLKPANIMLTSPPSDNWRIKLIDFGNSKRFNKESKNVSNIIGTEDFLAPDIIDQADKKGQSSLAELENSIPQNVWLAGDVWSLGEVIVRLFSNKPSFKNLHHRMQYSQDEVKFPMLPELKSVGSSSEARDFVQSAMKAKANSRMTIHEAAAHPWLKITDTSNSSKIISSIRPTVSSAQIKEGRYRDWDEDSQSSSESSLFASETSYNYQNSRSELFKTEFEDSISSIKNPSLASVPSNENQDFRSRTSQRELSLDWETTYDSKNALESRTPHHAPILR